QYRIAAADARLAQLKTIYTDQATAVKEALAERDSYSKQWEIAKTRSEQQDRASRTEAIRDDLSRKLLDLDLQLAGAEAEFTDQHPRVKGLRAQREVISKQLDNLDRPKQQ